MGWSILHRGLNRPPDWTIPAAIYVMGTVAPGQSVSAGSVASDPEGHPFEFFRGGGTAPDGVQVSTGANGQIVVSVPSGTPSGTYTVIAHVRPA